ncbi:hypothetical protein [Aliiroseovarius sp. 2305UL8-7]|uniref:hypothetical protein n=1 Tax=Aliiroseovarius conchicola TaxID=3121637 RepID=UPI0035278F17
MNVERGQLKVVRGVVTAWKEQLHSVHVDRSSGYGKINKTPELWLRDATGRERQFQGDLSDAAQPGHDVAVVIRRSNAKPIAFANMTTGIVHEGRDLTVQTSVQARLLDTFAFSLLCALPGLFPWFAILDAIGLGDSAFSAPALQIYVVVLVAGVYAGLTIWSKGYAERTEKLRSEMDRLIARTEPAIDDRPIQ